MKKTITFIILSFILVSISCVSQKTSSEANEALSPADKIQIDVAYIDESFFIKCTYLGDSQIFMKGVEFKNINGAVRKLPFFETERHTGEDGQVTESGICVPPFNEDFSAFIENGNIYARPIADLKQYEFKKVQIKLHP